MSLFWKDWRIARSLVGVGAACSVIVFAIQLCFSTATHPNVDGYFMTWGAIPAIIALGLSVMVIGGENDDRTFDWLRTLPISWQRVLITKLAVCLLSWLMVMGVATICLWFCHVWLDRTIGVPLFDDRFNWEKSASPFLMGLAMLSLSSISSFLVRSPVLAASLVFPLLYLLAMFLAIVSESSLWKWLVNGYLKQPEWAEPVCLLLGAALASATVLIVIARRRLQGPSDESWLRYRLPHLGFRVQVVRETKKPQRRPSQAKALLWQSARQNRRVIIGALTSSFALMVIDQDEFRSIFSPLLMTFFWLVHFVLGVSAFSGERKRPRIGFFADRGIEPTLVWWTRLLPPLLASIVIAVSILFWIDYFDIARDCRFIPLASKRYQVLLVVGSQLVAFSIGVLVGQWQTKPTYAYCVVPMIGFAWLSPVYSFLLQLYPNQSWLLIPAIAILLFAAWRLTPMVMKGQTGPNVWGRGVAYAMLAMLVVFAGMFLHVIRTTPAVMPEWRNELLAKDVSILPLEFETLPTSIYAKTDFRRFENEIRERLQQYSYQPDVSDWSSEQFQQTTYNQIRQLPKQLQLQDIRPASRTTASHFSQFARVFIDLQDVKRGFPIEMAGQIPPDFLISLMVPTQIEQYPGLVWNSVENDYIAKEDARKFRRLAIEIALMWTNHARAEALDSGNLNRLLLVAESSERLALCALQNIAKEQQLIEKDGSVSTNISNTKDLTEFKRLTALIPSAQLRKESRRAALMMEWQRFQKLETDFGSFRFDQPRYELAFERNRARQLMDAGTQLTLSQLEGELPSVQDPLFRKQLKTWENLFFPGGTFPQNSYTEDAIWSVYPVFVIEHERLIERLKTAANQMRRY